MRFARSHSHDALMAACLLLLLVLAHASSTTRNPVRALYNIQNSTIHTTTGRITALSDFDLSFILHSDLHSDLHVKLSLEPNHDILPNTGASVSYLGPDGEIVRQEPIDRLAHKVFKGVAWIRRDGIQRDDTWIQAGWARITVRRDGVHPLFEGAFSVDHDNHHIQMSENYARTKHPLDPVAEKAEDEFLVLYRDSDILRTEDLEYTHGELRRSLNLGFDGAITCQSDRLGFNNMPNHPVYLGMMKRSDAYWGSVSLPSLFNKRQIDSSTGGNSAGVNLVSTIGNSAGCPSTRKVALVGVATDCTYTAAFNSTESARQNVITQMNTASNLYESSFNISLGLQNLTISDPSCPGTPASTTPWNQACSDSVDISARLNMFSGWRGTLQDDNSHWTLLSTCNTGSAVGLAWLGQACVNTAESSNSTGTTSASGSNSETVSGANVVVRTEGASEWQIIAHETGHTFGAVHDCTSTTCADSQTVSSSQCCPLSGSTCDAGEKYIMNPSTAQGITNFSPCSIGNICSAIGRNSVRTTCLSDNKGVSTITGQQCGNGIVEPGEDCDCGGTAGCGDNNCCDPTTCKFKSNAVCDDSNEDCCNNCQLASAGSICRASTGTCDPAETCTGNTPTCPSDVTAPNGQSCGNGLQCASGQCTSRDLQCKTVMGSYTQGNDTYACDSMDCTISCASPEFGNGVCYGLQQNFLDGTTCGGGGKCMNGQCKGSTIGGQVKSWIDDHKPLVIGLAASIGALILFSLLSCIIGRCRRRRRAVPKNTTPSPPPGGWQGWVPPNQSAPYGNYSNPNGVPSDRPPPPPPHRGSGYGAPVMSGGGGPMWAPPSVPPPAYGPRSSVRYA